jgi:hypothetical protein
LIDLEGLVIAQVNGQDSWVTNTNLYRGQPRAFVDDTGNLFAQTACFVWLSSSGRPIYFAGDSTKAEYNATLTVVVRVTPEQVDTARTKVQTVMNLLDNTPPTGVFAAFADSAVAVNGGFDSQNCALASFTVSYRWFE